MTRKYRTYLLTTLLYTSPQFSGSFSVPISGLRSLRFTPAMFTPLHTGTAKKRVKQYIFFSSFSAVRNPKSLNLIGLSRRLQRSGFSHLEPEYGPLRSNIANFSSFLLRREATWNASNQTRVKQLGIPITFCARNVKRTPAPDLDWTAWGRRQANSTDI